jgi:flagellar hook protein FlgE
MSITSALLAGTSGLTANSSALAAISDNIANVNTVGYKRTQSLFSPLVKADSGSLSYNAGGVQPRNRQMIADQGVLQTASASTDLAVAGDGFFVVTTQPGQSTASDSYLFTRAGSFLPDDRGYLVNAAGYYLQGWPVNADGSVIANASDLRTLETINISSIGGTAEATTRVRMNANVQASTAVSTAAATYSAIAPANNMASGAVTPDFETSLQIFDSQGGIRTVTVMMLKSTTPNQWHAELVIEPATDVQTGAGLVNGQIATGLVAFDQYGRLDTTATTLPQTLNFLASDHAAALGATDVKWAGAEGIGAQTLDFEIGAGLAAGGLTQFDSESVLDSSTINGSIFGDLAGIEVDKNGFVIAKFTNGVVKSIYQVPIATFINPNGLQPESGGAFRVAANSGSFNMKQPGSGGAGLVSSRTLESSNVDLATEFTNLITTQRAYSASSKIITTADEMLDELIRMKR